MSGQGAVLQVVILRDGLLVGTEALVPGSYGIGSGANSDIRLDDPSVGGQHAMLYFQNGRAAIQDLGTPMGVYVNGHRVKTCEVRSQDEVTCGPFVLKIRVMAKAAEKAGPPPEIAALLRGPGTPPELKPTAMAKGTPAGLAPTVPRQQGGDGPQTAFSSRKRAQLRDDEDIPTQAVMVGDLDLDRRPAAKAPPPSARPRNGVEPNTLRESPPQPVSPPPAARAKPARAEKPEKRAAPRRMPKLSVPRFRGRGGPRLYFELYWGADRQIARSFNPDAKHPVIADAAESAELPLWGFSLPPDGFLIADAMANGFRVFVPPGSAVERQKGSDGFMPMAPKELSVDGAHRFVPLSMGDAIRMSSGEMSLVAYVAPPPEKVWVNPLRGLPYLSLTTLALSFFGLIFFLSNLPEQREAPFIPKNLPPVAVKLIAPEPKKKEEAKAKLEEIKEKAKPEKTAAKKPQKAAIAAKDKPPPKEAVAPAAESKALKALAKLSAAGPAMGDILAAVDKLGNGPGSKLVKSNYKLSNMIGKGPLANAGLGTFGLGGGGRGGMGTLGAELLRGRGGGGIGALGAGGFGHGAVGGTVTRASAHNVAVQGSIDREAVAKVVNSHLQEVRACYERALLKDPSLAGKVVLEWTISTTGAVVTAKTKTSSLRNGEVEGCILSSLKRWQFPLARGGVVIVSYPFMFNSVGY